MAQLYWQMWPCEINESIGYFPPCLKKGVRALRSTALINWLPQFP